MVELIQKQIFQNEEQQVLDYQEKLKSFYLRSNLIKYVRNKRNKSEMEMKQEQLLGIKQTSIGFSGYSSLVEHNPFVVEKQQQKYFYIHLQNHHQQRFTDNGQTYFEYYGDENQPKIFELVNRQIIQVKHNQGRQRTTRFIIELLILKLTIKLRRLPSKEEILIHIHNMRFPISQLDEILKKLTINLNEQGYINEEDNIYESYQKVHKQVNAIKSLICTFCKRIACQQHPVNTQNKTMIEYTTQADKDNNQEQQNQTQLSQMEKQQIVQQGSDYESFYQKVRQDKQAKQTLYDRQFIITYKEVFGSYYNFIKGLNLEQEEEQNNLKSIIQQRQRNQMNGIYKVLVGQITQNQQQITKQQLQVFLSDVLKLKRSTYISCNCPRGSNCQDDLCSCQTQYCDKSFCKCDPNSCQRTFQGCDCNDGCKNDFCPCEREQRFCQENLCRNCVDSNCLKLDKENNIVKLGLSKSTIPNAGLGLFALNFMRSGTVIGKYQGEIIDPLNDTYQYERRTLYKQFNAPSYIFDIQDSKHDYGFIDAQIYGNFLRFINHKSKKDQKSNLSAKYRKGPGDQMFVVLFANKDIKVGQELFFDYGNDYFIKSSNSPQNEVEQSNEETQQRQSDSVELIDIVQKRQRTKQ